MDFYIFLSFITGAWSTAFCFFLERAYSDLIKLKPSTKKKHEINEKLTEAFIKLDKVSQLELVVTMLKSHYELINAILETDTDSQDRFDINVALARLIGRIETKIEKLRQEN